ncbi:MAG TPA: hypothetical protein VK181_09705, partial [Rhizobium sp.]|nr:hypothetical protein [Rhizobium sp.]
MSAGFFNFALDTGPTPGITPSYTGGPEIVPGPRGGAMLSGPSLGAFEFDIGSVLPETFSGQRQHSFMDDYYFRVYFIPAALDLGTIAEPTVGNVVAWNADFRVATMTSVVPTIGLGMSYAGDPAPYPLKAMALRTWGVLVTLEGPPALNDALNFTFDTGQFYPLRVTAFRVQPLPENLWPWTINWKDGLNIAEEFKTDIIEARSGREQRIAMRSTPRKTLEFSILLRN